MTFTSFSFVLFFLLLLVMRGMVRGRGRIWLLLMASIAFYMTWSVPCVLVMLFIAMMDYSVGRKLGQTADPALRRRWLILSLCSNLGLLVFFKYANFFLENGRDLINACGGRVGPVHFEIMVPPGISYFTFASMSYVLDVYYERLSPCLNAGNYALFVSFFPKVLSGPIERAANFLPQLELPAHRTLEDIEAGLAQFLIGAVKKMVLADQVAGNVNQIFAAPGRFDRFTLLQGLLGYTAQLYCDFSGYSDMAIGCARVLGFSFPENFQFPFSSVTISEFWRRWHITMSAWFRDYLFLPLEIATRDNPNALLRISLNMTVTMLVCGLWHGPSWNYVIWGGLHGVALSAHRLWTARKPSHAWMKQPIARLVGNIGSRAMTIGMVVLALVFFRTPTLSDAMTYFTRMFSMAPQGERFLSLYIYPVVAVVALAHLLINKDRHLALELPRRSPMVRVAVYTGLLTVLAALAATDSAPFIYFKF